MKEIVPKPVPFMTPNGSDHHLLTNTRLAFGNLSSLLIDIRSDS
jgi:hypothetical protein